jgi:hypothetical protein
LCVKRKNPLTLRSLLKRGEIDLLITKAYMSLCIKYEIHSPEEPVEEVKIDLLLELKSFHVLCVSKEEI